MKVFFLLVQFFCNSSLLQSVKIAIPASVKLRKKLSSAQSSFLKFKMEQFYMLSGSRLKIFIQFIFESVPKPEGASHCRRRKFNWQD